MAVMGLDQVKQGARAGWAAGDYPAIAQRQQYIQQSVALDAQEEALVPSLES